MKSIHKFLLFLSLYLLLVPPKTYAQQNVPNASQSQYNSLRGMSPREWQPYGQMRGHIYQNTATFRLVRTQEERRPRDARALGPQDLGMPGIARPELINSIRQTRKRSFGGGWLWAGAGAQADASEGWTPLMEEPGDYGDQRKDNDLSTTEWWEQKFRGQGQRGGWFRARFGSSSSGSIRGGTGGVSSQARQPAGGGGGMGAGGMTGGR